MDARLLRIPSTFAGCWYLISITVPPVNSIEKFRPLVARKNTARRNVTSDTTLNASAWRMNGMSLRILKNSIGLFPGSVADRHALEFSARTVGEVDHAAAHHDRREYGREDPQAVHHGEAAHRPRAEDEERQPRDQRGDVGVEDGSEGALVARVDRRLRGGAATQLLAHALVDDDVGVDRHAERERDRGDAGQSERCLEHRQERNQEQQVGAQREHGERSEQRVVDDDEQRQRGEAVYRRVEALLDVLRAERRAYRALLDDLHGRGERARAKEERDVVRLDGGHAPADLDAPAADLAADHRRGDDFAPALFDEQDRHSLADVLARVFLEDARAGRVEGQVDGRFLGLVVEARLRVGQPVAREHDLFPHEKGLAVALYVELVAEGDLPALSRRERRRVHVVLVHHPHLEGRGAPEDLLGLGGVLHAGELHHDAVRALLLDHGLGDPQLVDAVVQSLDVLLEREFLRALLRLGADRADEAQLAPQAGIGEQQVRYLLADHRARLVAGLCVAGADHDAVALARDAGVTHVLVAQLRANVPGEAFRPLGDRRAHVHLQQEMHAPAEVQAEVHGERVNRGEPPGRIGQQVEGDGVAGVLRIGVQRPVDGVLGLGLRVVVSEPHLDARGIEEESRGPDPGILERLLDAPEKRAVHLQRRACRGDLHRRRLTEEVRQRVESPEHERHRDGDVDPEGITVHLDGFDRALGQERLDRASLYLHLGVGGDLDRHVGFAYLGDLPEHPAGRDDLVAFRQRLGHLLVLLGALHLRTDHQEIQQGEHADDDEELLVAGAGGAGRGALGECGGNQHDRLQCGFRQAGEYTIGTRAYPPDFRRASRKAAT